MQLIFSKDKAKIYIFFRKAINMIFYFPKKEKKGSVLKPSCKPILLSTQFHEPI